MNLLAQKPFWFDPPRSSPLKDASGDGGSDCKPSPHQPSRGQECNRHQRNQRPQSPWFPSPPPRLWVQEQLEFIINGFPNVV